MAIDSQSAPKRAEDGAEALLAFAIENLALVELHADLAIMHAQAGDVMGLVYSTRRLASYLKVIIPTVADLAEGYCSAEGRDRKEFTTEEPR